MFLLSNTYRKEFRLILFLFLFCLSGHLWANGITAVLMWTAYHLFFGNALIGIVEGLIVGMAYRINLAKSIGMMIAANYFSMIITFSAGWSLFPTIGLYHAMTWARFIPLFCFLTTILLEWPFGLCIFWQNSSRIKKSSLAIITVNAISYLFLVPFYYHQSEFSFFQYVKPNPAMVATCPLAAEVYYLSPNDQALCRININGQGKQKLQHLTFDENTFNHALFSQPAADSAHWELWHQFLTNHNHEQKILDLPPDCLVTDWKYRHDPAGDSYEVQTIESILLTTDDTSSITVNTDRFRHRLLIQNHKTHHDVRLEHQLPCMEYNFSSPTLLPQDYVVFQLNDQIALLDLKTMEVGIITEGISPIVSINVKQ